MNYRRVVMNVLRASILYCSVAHAHHSGAAVDITRTVTISGTVKEYVWANPHCWLYVLVANDAGGADEWAMEGPPVMGMAQKGMRSKSLQPGDKVEVTLSPRKDGNRGGGLRTIKLLETGQTFELGQQFPAQPPPQ